MRHILKILLCASLILHSSFFILHSQELSLDSCLALARRNNYEIRTSQLEIAKSQALKQQVFTKYFPQFSLQGLGYYALDPLVHFGIEDIQSNDMRELLQALYETVATGSDLRNEVDLMKKGASASLTVVQPLYAGGRIVNGNKLAGLGVEAAELQSQMKERDMLENVASTFYLVTGLQEKVATVEAALALIDSLDRTVQVALENGLVTRSDALQVELKRNEMLANRQQLTSGIRLARRLLCRQIGIDYSESLVFKASPPAPLRLERGVDSRGVPPCTPVNTRPEARLLELGVEVELLRKRLTVGETLPQVALIGSAFYGNIIKESATGNGVALLSVSVPLTAWWETSHKLRQHDIAIEEARMQQEHLGQMMSLEEEKAYSDMLDAWSLLRSDSSALEIARENYRLATLNYQVGSITLAEVLQAHALLLQAQNAITDRRTTYLVARRRLMDLGLTPSH